jgi:transcription elongation GreA/GreB family factor
MADTIKVTREGYAKLIEKKQSFVDQLKDTQFKKGEAAEVGGNAWHDNFSFEELGRQEAMLNKRIADASAEINRAELVESPTDEEYLQIGHVAVFEFDDGEERKFEIAGFGESEIAATPPKVEYLAPLVREFVGKEAGTCAKVEIGGRSREITLVKIMRKEAQIVHRD